MSNCTALRNQLKAHSQLKHLANAIIEPLPSESHQVFYVETGNLCGALKWLDSVHIRFIDATDESSNEAIAAKLGLAPESYYTDSQFRFTKWVGGARCLTRQDLYNDQSAAWVIKSIARLHNSTTEFANTISMLEAIEWNITQNPNPTATLLASRSLLNRVANLNANDRLVCCHGDLVCENILVTHKDSACNIQLIDWEYSHLASAYWDLANLSHSAELDTKRKKWLLNLYAQYTPESDWQPDYKKLEVYIEVAELLNRLWQENRGLQDS